MTVPVAETDPQLAVAVLTSIFAAATVMVGLGLAKKRLSWKAPYCRVCRAAAPRRLQDPLDALIQPQGGQEKPSSAAATRRGSVETL